MLETRKHAFRAVLSLLLVAFSTSPISGQVTVTTPRKNASPAIATASTSPSRSINYITESLPQQCLTSSWTRKSQHHDSLTNHSTTVPSITESLNIVKVTDTSNATAISARKKEGATSAVKADSSTVAIAAEAPSASIQQTKPLQTVSEAISETEIDSPFDNANFLSFEEWKHQNLAKAGQSVESLEKRVDTSSRQGRRPGNINNALDSLGEDVEIDIDFGGFVNPGPMQQAPRLRGAQAQAKEDIGDIQSNEGDAAKDSSGLRKRPKDAGRTCKERTNYASYDCAATTVKTNPECKSSSAVLVENKDSYMLNICSARNKFFIVELCDNILIDTVVLANFEFFSSMFRTFRLSVSDIYPVKLEMWREVGIYEARNSRDVQAFLVENPLIWARYLRVEFLTHYGNEYYCPVSLLRVHGTTMMEEFNSEMKNSSGDDDSENENADAEVTGNMPKANVAEELKKTPAEGTEQIVDLQADSESLAATSTPKSISTPLTILPVDEFIHASLASINLTAYNSSAYAQIESLFKSMTYFDKACTCQAESFSAVDQTRGSPIITQEVTIVSPSSEASKLPVNSLLTSVKQASKLAATSNVSSTSKNSSSVPISASINSTLSRTLRNLPTSLSDTSIVNTTSGSTVKAPSSSTQPPASNPTTQESFFKSVHKRLQLLEANSTLSLQYIEEQSCILRGAFSKVEKRQMAKTSNFLEILNSTVLTELLEFRKQYDQIWQSTVLELSSQREESQREVLALSTRLSLLADELVFQKRMAILQFFLILLCLGLVIFSRHGSTAAPYFEIPPLVQNAIHKSSNNLARYAPHIDSPPTSPSGTRPTSSSSRYSLLRAFTHRQSPGEEPFISPVEERRGTEYSPLTPDSQRSAAEDADSSPASSSRREDRGDGPPDPDEQTRSSSSPPSPERIRQARDSIED